MEGGYTLNPGQLAALDARGDSVLVTAGAGSGKTGVLTDCVVGSIVDDGIESGRVLALTFTNKAAAEMKNRIRGKLAAAVAAGDLSSSAYADADPVVETIDAFCHRLVSRNSLRLGLDPSMELLTSASDRGALEAAAWEAGVRPLLSGERREEVLSLLIRYHGVDRTVRSLHEALRTAGQEKPRLEVPTDGELRRDLVEPALAELAGAARSLESLLGRSTRPDLSTVSNALETCRGILSLIEQDKFAQPLPKLKSHAKVEECESAEWIACVAALETVDKCLREADALPDLRLFAELLDLHGEALVRIKREKGVLGFPDVELLARQLLREQAGMDGHEPPFERVYVDEFQDLNPLQKEIIDLVSGGSYFAVGDAAQSIYGFRGSEVGLFLQRADELPDGSKHELNVNYRSAAAIVGFNNHVFGSLGVEGLQPLEVGSTQPGVQPAVEFRLVDSPSADDGEDGQPASSTTAEERREMEGAVVALRIHELLEAGRSPGEVAVLGMTRSALMPVAEQLRLLGVPVVLEDIGGLWERPEVDDLVAFVAAVANPNDETRLLAMLRSPLCGLSIDGLVLVARQAARARIPIFEVLDRQQAPGLDDDDRRALKRFIPWFNRQRDLAGSRQLAEMLEAALVETGFDLYLLRLREGERLLANVRSLQAFAREWESEHGSDPVAFADEAARLGTLARNDVEEGEAVVEQDGDDGGAVRMMTVHRAKGLEFPVVFVPGLGSRPRPDRTLLHADGEGRRVSFRHRPEADGRSAGPHLFDDALPSEFAQRQAHERRRVLYVACTRAKEQLILSAAVERTKNTGAIRAGSVLEEIQPHFLPGFDDRLGAGESTWNEGFANGAALSVTIDRGEARDGIASRLAAASTAVSTDEPEHSPGALDPAVIGVHPSRLSYSGLQAALKCPYRWYVEEIVGVPAVEKHVSGRSGQLPARLRGTVMHALLEVLPLDGTVPSAGDAKAAAARVQEELDDMKAGQVADLATAIVRSDAWVKLVEAAASDPSMVRREEGFAMSLDCGNGRRTPLHGVLDACVLDRSGGGSALVIDWKSSNRAADGADLHALVDADYGLQRAAYALAVLRGPSPPAEVTVMYVFAERPDEPVSTSFSGTHAPGLEQALVDAAAPLLEGEVPVSDEPNRWLCDGCPARGTLCTHPLEATMVDPQG